MREFLRLFLSITLSGGLLTALTACLNRLLRGRVPKTMLYYLWLLVLLRFLCPAGTSWSLSHRLIAQPLMSQSRGTVAPAPPAPAEGAAPADQSPEVKLPVQTEPVPSGPRPDPSPPQIEAETVLIAVWAAGVLAVLGWHMASYIRLKGALKREELPVSPWEQELFSALTAGGRRPPRLRRSAAINTPMLAGLLRPAVWIPAGETDRSVLGHALRHELTHWRRYDLLYKWILLLAAGLHWFNPAVWYLVRAVERDCELSCDEGAVRDLSQEERSAYGAMLLWAAAWQSRIPGGTLAPLWSQKENLRERLRGIMEPMGKSGRTKRLFAAAAIVVAAASAALGAYAVQAGEREPEIPAPETGLNLMWLEDRGLTAESAVEAEDAGVVVARRAEGGQAVLLTRDGGASWEELTLPRAEYGPFGELTFDPEAWLEDTLRVLADLPEEDITLYGVWLGKELDRDPWVILRRGERLDQFPAVTFSEGPRLVPSKMALADYDGDGTGELAVSTCVGTGSGVEAHRLYLFEESGDGGFVLSASLTEEELWEQIEAAVESSYDPDTFTYSIQTAGESWRCDLSGDSDWLAEAPMGPLVGSDCFRYTLAPLWLSINLRPEQMPIYDVAGYTADLNYDGTSITLDLLSGRLEEIPGCPLEKREPAQR